MCVTERFKPQLRSTVEIRPFDTIEDGEFVLLRNLENARYLKVKKSANGLLENMDGCTSVGQLQRMYKDIDVYHLVETLARTGFLTHCEAEVNKGPLYTVKIPFFDANKEWMKRIYRFFRFTGNKYFLFVYSAFILSGFVLFLNNFGAIVDQAYMNFHLGVPLRNLLAVFVIFYVVELLHEFAHTGASYNCGGEPQKLGLTFHFLVAFFYVDTPDTRIMDKRGNICTFISGPLVSLLAAEISTYLFVFTGSNSIVWGFSSFFWHISTVITLAPFMHTDGYYIVQYLVKFPNLLDHSLVYAQVQLKRLFQLMTGEEYKKTMARWNVKQKKFLRVYMLLWPVQTAILVYFFYFSVNKAHVMSVFEALPDIFSAHNPYGLKGYFLVVFYIWGIVAGILPVVMTIQKYIKKRGGTVSVTQPG